MGSVSTAISTKERVAAGVEHSAKGDGWLERMTGWIDASPGRAFALLTVFYLVVVCSLSSMKLLWLDELITLHIARLNSVTAIWHALAQGADPNPPLIHVAVMLCRRAFGEHELGLRLPALVGYWVGMVSLFLFLKRRMTPTWALAGTLLSMANAAFDYSFESRSYGVFYGLAMAGVLCWSRAVDADRRTRRLYLFFMTFSLALGISTNYFAVLAILPIAFGELVLSLRRFQSTPPSALTRLRLRGAIDAPVWGCLVLAVTPLIAFRPLIERSIAKFAPHAWNKVSLSQVFDSYTQMVEIVLYPLLALFALFLVLYSLGKIVNIGRGNLQPQWLGRLVQCQARTNFCFPLHELTAALTLMLYPFLGYLVARLHGGMLSPRFVIPVCLGFAIVGIAVALRIFGSLRLSGPIALTFCLAWFVSRESYVGYTYNEQKQSFYKVIKTFPATYTSGPIIISDPLMALTFQHYAPAALANRIVFPIDFPAVRGYRGDDSPEQNMFAGRDVIYHLPLEALSDLQCTSADYLILAADGNWLVDVLRDHSYPAERLPINTRAGAIGGFTPIAHGVPAYFFAAGDRSSRTALPLLPAPWPFDPAAAKPEGADVAGAAECRVK